jgi:predicted HicB family RNase H-like nuclease
MTIMRHKGYLARIELDEEQGLFVGEVINLRGAITFAAADASSLRREFTCSVEAFEALCARKGIATPKPLSGRFMLRLPPEQHARLTAAAAMSGKSLNAWAAEVLDRVAERELAEKS